MGSGGRFRCPSCRYEVMLDRHGVYGLQRNLLVENIIDMYQSESKKPFRKLEVLMCEEHEDEKVNIFCITCQKPTCSLCKVFGQHQECNVSPVDKVYKDHKAEISAAIAMLVAGNDRLQSIISTTEELVTKTEDNSKVSQSTVAEAFDKLYSILEEKKQHMLSQVKSVAQEKKEGLQVILKQYGSQLEKSSKLVEEALSLLEEPNAAQFLSVSRELIGRVTASAKASDVEKPPNNVHEMEMFNLDFTDIEASLSAIKFDGFDDIEERVPRATEELQSASDGEAPTSATPSGASFRAKLLLPKDDEAVGVVASAEITKAADDVESLGSRRDSLKLMGEDDDTNDSLDGLDSEVKAIAEKYLAGRAARTSSQSSRRSDSNNDRRKSYSDEQSDGSTQDTWRPEQSPYWRGTSAATAPSSVKYSGYLRDALGDGENSRSPTRSSSPSDRLRGPRVSFANVPPYPSVDRDDENDSVTEVQESTEALLARIPQRSRRTRRLPRTYTTHRRRTWSHLLDKK